MGAIQGLLLAQYEVLRETAILLLKHSMKQWKS